MAKESMKQRELKRARMRQAASGKRAKYKAAVKALRKGEMSPEEGFETLMKLRESMPANASPVREKKRCFLTGRPRGYHRRFGISRVELRKKASQGLLPGVLKSSW